MDPDDRPSNSEVNIITSIANPRDATIDPIQDLAATNEKEEAVHEFTETEKLEPFIPENPYSQPSDQEDTDPVSKEHDDLERVYLEERVALDASLPGQTVLGKILSTGDGPSRSPSPSPRGSQERIRIQEERVLLEKGTKSVLSNGATPLPLVVSTESIKDSIHLVRWWLYLAEVFGRWGDRMWSFTAALFLLELFPGTMLLPAIHGLITGSCVILFGSLIGEWVDATARLKAVRTALFIQNSCVACGSLILTFAFWYRDTMSTTGRMWCVAGFLVFAVVADCASVGMNIIVEKDWVVVIASGNKKGLADLNATIRRIDLTCQILSPIIIAQIMTFSAHYIGTIVVSAWNVCSMVIEYAILMKIYRRVPRLSFKPLVSPTERKQKPLTRKIFKSCFAIHDGWKIYFKTRVWPAGVGLAFLYMTVLAFGGVTNTYIRTQGLSESVISVMMALGAAVGITGTFVFPKMREKFGLERTGLMALGAQLICLMFCVLSIWLPGTPFDAQFYSKVSNETVLHLAEGNRTATGIDKKQWITKPTDELPSVIVFLFGMIAARFGLWMADLTITQLIQENIAEKERGIVGGVQSSFNRFMDMLKFILVICLPNPQTFGFLIIVSFVFVATGHVFYAIFAIRSGRQSRSRSVPLVVVTRDVQQSPPLLPKNAPQDT